MILTRPAYQAAMPPISPPPPTATSSVSSSRRLLLELEPERALPEQRLDLVVGVDRQRARLGRPRLARRERVGVPLAADDELGAVVADPLRFAGEATAGTKIFAGTPSFIAAYATAAPWLPPEAATTPAAGTLRISRFANAPRGLNEPVCWKSSSLSVSGMGPSPSSSPRTSMIGVRRTCGAIRRCAAAIASRSIIRSARGEELPAV